MAWRRGANNRTADPDAENPAVYRHRVVIQTLQGTSPPTYNAAGQVLTWQTYYSCPAGISPLSARDIINYGQQTSEAEVPIKIRYNPFFPVAANMRVYFPSHNSTYVIQGIINKDERNRSLTLMCIALGANL